MTQKSYRQMNRKQKFYMIFSKFLFKLIQTQAKTKSDGRTDISGILLNFNGFCRSVQFCCCCSFIVDIVNNISTSTL